MEETEQTSKKGKLPPYGSVQWYGKFLDLCQRRKIDKVDAQFLTIHDVVSKGNEYKVLSGLQFLGLIKEDGSPTDKMKSLGVMGEDFKKNLKTIVREAYAPLFDSFKGDLTKAKPEEIINFLRGSTYGMAPSTSETAAQVFVFLAHEAEIPLSQEIIDELYVPLEKRKRRDVTVAKGKPRVHKKELMEYEIIKRQLPEGVLARFMLRDTGYVDIRTREDLEIAKAYWKKLENILQVDEGIN